MAQQTEAHDWLGDCAENYIAYLFARAGFEVFGSSKWGADVAVHKKRTLKWWRVEVRSADKGKKPRRKPVRKLKKNAELLAEVRFDEPQISVTIHRLSQGRRTKDKVQNPTKAQLRSLLKKSGAQPNA